MITPGYSIQDLANLNAGSSYYQHKISYMNVRDRAIKETAESLGMQSALAAESKVIDKVLSAHSAALDKVFDFRLLMYKGNILPPVIIQAQNLARVNNAGTSIHVGGRTYRIISQVRFVTTPPTWRSYLWMSYQEPTYPNKVLLPKTSQERDIWQTAIQVGWKEGIEQALSIYQINLNRLVRDFNGMVLYKKLLAENMISPFAMTKTDYGITGNANHMTIDNQTWQIVAKPQLQFHGALWSPVLMTNQVAQTTKSSAQADSMSVSS